MPAVAAVVAPVAAPVAAGSGPVTITGDGSTIALYSPDPLDPASVARSGVYLYDVATGMFTSQSTMLPDGTVATAFRPAIAAGGGELAVLAAGPLAGETTGGGGIYVRSLPSGPFRALVPNVFPDGLIEISADGSVLAYEGSSDGGSEELYVVSTAGGPPLPIASGGPPAPSLSGDGRLLAYTSYRGGIARVVVRDLQTGVTQVASSDSAGVPGSGGHAAISADGRFVAFRSADELVPDAGGRADVYVKDLVSGETRLASTTAEGRLPPGTASPGGGYCCSPVGISGDGRYVAFASSALLTPDADGSYALYVKDMQTGAITRVALGRAAYIDPGELSLSADGRSLAFVTRAPGSTDDGTGTVQLVHITPAEATCETPGPQQSLGLSADEQRLLDLKLEPRRAALRAVRAALAADVRAHPQRRAADAEDLRALTAIAARYRPHAAASGADVARLIDGAKCGLLGDAHASLAAYLSRKGLDREQYFAGALLDLRDVLEGGASDSQRAQLLKASVSEWFQRVAGKGDSSYASHAYELLDAHLAGALTDNARTVVGKDLLAVVKKVATGSFEGEAGELVDRLLTLRDVIAGSPSDVKKFQVLEDSIAGLDVALLGKKRFDTAQVRAAMLGFQLGQTFGERIAEDLDLIANFELERDCAAALSAKQSRHGAVNYEEPTRATVPSGRFYEGWRCAIQPDGFVAGLGGVVQATRPADATLTDAILWRTTTAGDAVLYDTRFTG
jgi:hypothetical protein